MHYTIEWCLPRYLLPDCIYILTFQVFLLQNFVLRSTFGLLVLSVSGVRARELLLMKTLKVRTRLLIFDLAMST